MLQFAIHQLQFKIFKYCALDLSVFQRGKESKQRDVTHLPEEVVVAVVAAEVQEQMQSGGGGSGHYRPDKGQR